MPNQYTVLPLRERLLSGGTRNGKCLLWNGRRNQDGYGMLDYRGKSERVHVLSYTTFVGPVPEGLQVHHSCNIRHCYEPSHLSVGTNQQNMAYRNACGRQARGERHARVKLTEEQVLEIREKAKAIGNARKGKQRDVPSLRSLTREYGVSWRTIHRIVDGTGWTHI